MMSGIYDHMDVVMMWKVVNSFIKKREIPKNFPFLYEWCHENSS